MSKIQFNRQELAGSFGDIGTDLPLILALIASASLDFSSVFFMFGVMQIFSGVFYGLPMPMQPLKAMAIIVITQKIPAALFYTAGFTMGLTMLVLTITGLLAWLQKKIPHHVVRGLQLGLVISLVKISLFKYIDLDQWQGIIMAVIALGVYFFFKNNKKIPASLLLIAMGLVVTFLGAHPLEAQNFKLEARSPLFFIPEVKEILPAFILLVLPQLPLSLSNSIIATHKTIHDLFPDKKVSINKIGLSYSLINLFNPFLSGIPLCHGCGGLAGHHAFGARTGGSVVIYGTLFVMIGVFFSQSGLQILSAFPQTILGVMLLIEAWALHKITRDVWQKDGDFLITIIVALIAGFLPQGYLIGTLVGVILYYLRRA